MRECKRGRCNRFGKMLAVGPTRNGCFCKLVEPPLRSGPAIKPDAEPQTGAMAAMNDRLPVLVVGGGPVGLTTALGLSFYDIPFELFEEDDALSKDTKAGGTLTR